MSVLLIIKLKKIIYSGKNIGNDLIFQFAVKGQVTSVKPGISSGEHKSFNKVLFQGTFTPVRRPAVLRHSALRRRVRRIRRGGEGGSLGAGGEDSVSLPIRVAITEKDTVFDDTGSGSSSFKVQLQETEPQTHSFNASVIASGGDRGKRATFTFVMEANVEDVKVELTGPDNVVLGDQFTLNATVTPAWNGTADISIETGANYSSTMRAETYWDTEGNVENTPQYKHEFGIRLPVPATLTINKGTGSFIVTQFTMEPFKIKITLQGLQNCETTYEITKEDCWAHVKVTYIGQPLGSETEGNTPGFFDNDKPRAALPYGLPSLFDSWIVLKKTLAGGSIDVKIRDRGPWFPYKTAYPKNNNWYNDYWDDAGWKPLAEFMNGLRRVDDTNTWRSINGAGLDLTEKAITDLGFSFSTAWSGTVYWRLK